MAQGLYLLREQAGNRAYAAGEEMFRHQAVRSISNTEQELHYYVYDTPVREVIISSSADSTCNCDDCSATGACAHIVAATLFAQEKGELNRILHEKARSSAQFLMQAAELALPTDGSVHLQTTLTVDKPELGRYPNISLSLRIGEERFYVVRSIYQLLSSLKTKQPIEFGKGFEFHPEWMRFPQESKDLLHILTEIYDARESISQSTSVDTKNLTVPNSFHTRIFQALSNSNYILNIENKKTHIHSLKKVRLPLHFKLTGSLRGMLITGYFPVNMIPLTHDCRFIYLDNSVIEIEADQRRMVKVLWQNQYAGRTAFEYSVKETARVISDILPHLKLLGSVEIDSALDKQLVRVPLQPQVYLDVVDSSVVAQCRFKYGDKNIDPFSETELPETLPRNEKILLRDGKAEAAVLDFLGAAGFFVHKGGIYLDSSQKIFEFVTNGITQLQQVCEVYFSKGFHKISPKKPQLQGNMRINGFHLELEFTDNGQPAEEILRIMEALSLHRRYYRLKDGSFLDLSSMEEWQDIADAVWEASALDGVRQETGSVISLNSYRTTYLQSLISGQNCNIVYDQSISEHLQTDKHQECTVVFPNGLSLRPYQQRGFQWLSTLDDLHMGGILADDMGLGKTLQVISVLKETKTKGSCSIVVAPTSLTYNWMNELSHFAPELSVVVLSGSSVQRQSTIEHIQSAMDIDVLITSYPLIRRDINLIKQIPFRFAILDEAQQIKNAGSVAASAVKQLQAQTRFALTGTPMENHPGELWSIFDFILPGYLSGYSAFLRRYQDGKDLQDLQKRIRPFLLRRLKKDVLYDLPDKQETTLVAQMTPEQSRVYQAAMFRIKSRVDHMLEEKGMNKSRVEILAALTELRQICCHPSLVLEDYSGTSGKLELLLDMLPEAIASGRRILLFSQFTSMLKILQRQLESQNYECLYLDGSTPPEQRLELTEKFNAGKGKIFLISLKAGGTGLNLTGADMVIHYDPWWNPASEDQATDRAHRIGQTRKVDVIKLMTYQSIEEKVIEMGLRKKAMFDQLITPGEQLITKMTEQDIRSLFS